jgi:hypothetical protein
MSQMDDNSVKIYAELSLKSNSKFRRTIIILVKLVIELEIFLRQRDGRNFELEERIRERVSRESMRYSP